MEEWQRDTESIQKTFQRPKKKNKKKPVQVKNNTEYKVENIYRQISTDMNKWLNEQMRNERQMHADFPNNQLNALPWREV